MYMVFRLENVWSYLVSHGEVYTVRRTYRHPRHGSIIKEAKVKLCRSYGKPEFSGVRLWIKHVKCKGDLVGYVQLSGFTSLNDWWDAVVKLHRTLEDLSLYRASVVEAKPKLYKCNVCGETFSTETGKGRMHMASRHGRSLKYALKSGLCVRLE